MIIQCQSCSRKFSVRDQDIPREGRMVQCGYCSVSWHQMPVAIRTKTLSQGNIINEPANKERNSEAVSGFVAKTGM